MMGAGKSALGRAVAERSGVAFVDLDVEVERRAGMSIRQIFEKQGEAAFRVMEREGVARELADPTPRVIAVGGGSLLTRSLRLQALERGIVLTLRATPAELVRRVSGDASRPMLGAAPTEARVIELLEARASAYAEAHAVLDTTGASLEVLATEVLRLAELEPIAVPLGERTYAVDVVPG